MEINDISGMVITFVLVGLIIGVGVLVMDKFGTSVRDKTPVNNETITWANSTNATLAHNDLVTVSSVVIDNGTTVPTTDYQPFIVDGKLYMKMNSTATDGATVGVYYTYNDYDTPATQVLSNTTSSITPIASDWMPIMVTVAALAIILVLVFRSFGNKR